MHSTRVTAILLTFSLLILSLPAMAQIEISGPQSGTLGAGDYLITGNLSVQSGDELTIDAGAHFEADGPYSFLVQGILYANGTETEPVIFEDDSSAWQGITISGADNVLTNLTHVTVRDVMSASASLTIITAAPVINQCTFEDNAGPGMELGSGAIVQVFNCTITGNSSRGIVSGGGSQLIMTGGQVSGNSGLFGGGISSFGGVLNLTEVTVDGNSTSGFDQPGGGGIYASSTQVQLTDCSITNNTSYDDDDGGDGGGLYVNGGNLIMTNCVVSGNSMEAWDINSGGGGAYVNAALVEITDCVFSNNETMGYQLGGAGAGLLLENCSGPIVRRGMIVDNDAMGEYGFGGGIALFDCVDPRVERVIIHQNTSEVMGAGIYLDNTTGALLYHLVLSANHNQWAEGDGLYSTGSVFDLHNSVVYQQDGDGVFFGPDTDGTVAFSDFHGPGQDHFAGDVPGLLGLINQENYNGDPSDMYYNIFLDPLFVAPDQLDFSLENGSPCIDAGDPQSDPDPDGSIADQGAVSFEGAGVVLQMEPVLTVVPPAGGEVVYHVTVTSEIPQAIPGVSWWTKVTLPNGQTLTQPIEYLQFTLPPYADIFVSGRTLAVPGFAPAGEYTYAGHVGFYPSGPQRQDSFFFTKTGAVGEGDLSAASFVASGGQRTVQPGQPH